MNDITEEDVMKYCYSRNLMLVTRESLEYMHRPIVIETMNKNAIPVEWLKNKISQYEDAILSLRDRSYYKTNLGEVYVHSLTTSEVERLNDLRRKSSCYSTILEDWEKENEI